jgi:hypothetical protein
LVVLRDEQFFGTIFILCGNQYYEVSYDAAESFRVIGHKNRATASLIHHICNYEVIHRGAGGLNPANQLIMDTIVHIQKAAKEAANHWATTPTDPSDYRSVLADVFD